MTMVLKDLTSLAGDVVDLGTPFSVSYKVTGNSGDSGTIVISCIDPTYSASPDIPVTLGPGEKSKIGQAQITIRGPAGRAAVVVQGLLVENHRFNQDVE